MPGAASSTGLLPARLTSVFRPKPKDVELLGSTKPAPLALRPFAGLFNPYPYGCSVLCNHPADCEAKDVVRRAKDTWASEGRAILLPEELEMIRHGLLAANVNPGTVEIPANLLVPEELFRKYTETDSRPLTPTPTLASGPGNTLRKTPEDPPRICKPRERTTLVLDLRTEPPEQENETFTWHAMTLEPPPQPPLRKLEINRCKVKNHPRALHRPELSVKIHQREDEPQMIVDDEDGTESEEPVVITRRRGKRLRKRKCRRGSTYADQPEIRDPLETAETQVSQVDDVSRRSSTQRLPGDKFDEENSNEAVVVPVLRPTFKSSFIPLEILKHLCRELDVKTVEAEFSTKKRAALEEALRVKGENNLIADELTHYRSSESSQDHPRLFSRQTARFELLGAQSLIGLVPLEYLTLHVSVTRGRKLTYRRAFDKFCDNGRTIPSGKIIEGLRETLGKPLTDEDTIRLNSLVGEVVESLNFRTWCGFCAAAERILPVLPSREDDPPSWLERVDFEALDRRLTSVCVDPRLGKLLKEIRDR